MPIKLFVGQLPKTMDEEELKAIVSEFGAPLSVDIIRDKTTMAHKGCAFLTFETKDEADHVVVSLHNVKILPNMHSPMQVKFADGELQRLQHKLFVGMLPKTANEEDLKEIFATYGEIEEATILKDSTGVSRACGFVKYKEREQAQQAIQFLNGTMLPGQSKSLIVRFAETEQVKKEKQQLKLLASQQASMLRLNPLLSQLVNPIYAQSILQGAQAAQAPNPYVTAAAQYQPAAQYLQPGQQTYSDATYPPGTQANLANPYGNLATAYGAYAQGAVPAVYGASPFLLPAVSAAPEGPQKQGPPGANLFIYHLPQEWRDAELLQTFAPYGNVVSAKVFIDKHTLASKCFGFISYDSVPAAADAIAKLNGLHVGGNKRLKVEVKRNQNPY